MRPEREGPSLEDLGKTYAELLRQDPYRRAEAPITGVPESGEPLEWAADLSEADACPVTPQSILEAMLFVGRADNRPLGSDEVAALMRGVAARDIDGFVASLNQAYEREQAAYRIAFRNGGYRLELSADMEPVRYRFHRRPGGARLSPAAIEVLALVAYQQPASRQSIEQRRGANSSALLRQLVRRRLLVLERREREIFYRTSDYFLKLLGLDSLDQLPDIQSVERG